MFRKFLSILVIPIFLIIYIAVYMIFGDDEDLDGWSTREFYGDDSTDQPKQMAIRNILHVQKDRSKLQLRSVNNQKNVQTNPNTERKQKQWLETRI